MSDVAARPIGVFDSGVGGLTVVREIWRRLPAESVVYFGDTARLPYGPKSPDIVRRYAREAAGFLLAREVKLVIIACNTATAHACHVLRRELPVPVVGVIEPGARAAIRSTRSGRIGVIGTAGTIGSGAYDREIRRLLMSARVYAQPCPVLVPLVEEGWAEHPATRLVAEAYLGPLREMNIDALILACTHYPLVRPMIAEILDERVAIVDSAEEAVADAVRALRSRGWLAPGNTPPLHSFGVSDSPLRFREVSSRFLGRPVPSIEMVDPSDYDVAA